MSVGGRGGGRRGGGESGFHRLDAGVKTAVTLAFIVTVVSFPEHTVSALCPYLAYPLLVAVWAGIPLRHLGRQLLALSPFALAVGAFNPLLDTRPMASVGGLEISGGWLSFLSIALRFVLTASAAVILVSTTPFPRICASLSVARVPRVLVTQLVLTARYLWALRQQAAALLRARALRSQGRRGLDLRSAGSMIAALFLRSLGRGERVHRAMLARGFAGELRMLGGAARARASDLAFLVASVSLFALLRVLPALAWAGPRGVGSW